MLGDFTYTLHPNKNPIAYIIMALETDDFQKSVLMNNLLRPLRVHRADEDHEVGEFRDKVLGSGDKASFKEYKTLKMRILSKAISEINKETAHQVELVEFKEGGGLRRSSSRSVARTRRHRLGMQRYRKWLATWLALAFQEQRPSDC